MGCEMASILNNCLSETLICGSHGFCFVGSHLLRSRSKMLLTQMVFKWRFSPTSFGQHALFSEGIIADIFDNFRSFPFQT